MTSRSLGHRAPLLWVVLPFIGGLSMGHAVDCAEVRWQLAVALVAALSAVFAAWRAPRWWAPAIALAMGCAGNASYILQRARLAGWEGLPPREARLALEVERVFPNLDPRKSALLARVAHATGPLRELVRQRVYVSLTLRKGESPPLRSAIVIAGGILTLVPRHPSVESFDGYLANAGVNFRLARGRVLAVERPPTRYHVFLEQGAEKLNAWLSLGIAGERPQLTAIFRAMMLGQKYELTEEQGALFMHSGTMHLFAINGIHIGVVALSLHALLTVLRCPRTAGVAVMLAVLWLDVDTTGASPSAVRAFLLVAALRVGLLLRRPRNGLAALSTAGLVVLLYDPMALFSASFQMSYGVVFAILCFGLVLAEKIEARWKPFRSLPEATWTRWHHAMSWLARYSWPVLGIGVASSLVSALTGPAFFQTLAPGGFGANLVLVPLAMAVIVAGFVSVLAGLAGFTPAVVLFNHAALVLLTLIDALIRADVRVPATWWEAHWRIPDLAPVALAALLAIILTGYAWGWRRERGGFWPPFAFVALVLLFGVKIGHS